MRFGSVTAGRLRSSDAGRTRIDAELEGYRVRLSYRAPYDWDSLLEFLAARAIPGVEEAASGVYRRTFSDDGRVGVLEVRHDRPRLALEARVHVTDPASLLPILARVRGMFDLDADTAAIGKHLGSDPFLHPLVRRHPGLRVPGAWDPFEMAVRAVLGESMAGAAGSDLCDLVRRLGPQRHAPRRPAAARAEFFRPPKRWHTPGATACLRVTRERSESLAQTALSGADEESLLRVPGLGESTSQYVALRAFRRPDAFPADDPTLHDVAGAAERWRPWRAYAAMHLWRASVPRD